VLLNVYFGINGTKNSEKPQYDIIFKRRYSQYVSIPRRDLSASATYDKRDKSFK
jgi:hypothetical protein